MLIHPGLIELIKGPPMKVAITTHHKPDADALGSSLAMWAFLKKLGHSPLVITPTDYPPFLFWMNGNDEVVNYDLEKNRNRADLFINESTLIICLDFSRIDRIGPLEQVVRKAGGKILLIDHHLDKEDFAHFEYCDTKAAATCELVFDFISRLGETDRIDIPIAECLYAGIMTDTGSFRHPSTTKRVHNIIAELIGLGLKPNRIHRLIYDNYTEQRLRFLGYVLSNKMKVFHDQKVAYIWIGADELKRYNSQTGDTEGLVNYPLSIDGIKVAALFVDRTEAIKISFRSVEDVAVNQFAAQYFEGGGHKNAAGGKSNLSLEETIRKFEKLMPELVNN